MLRSKFSSIIWKELDAELRKHQIWIILLLALSLLIVLSVDVAQQFGLLSFGSTLLLSALYITLLLVYRKVLWRFFVCSRRYLLLVPLVLLVFPLATKLSVEIGALRASRHWETLSRSYVQKDAETIQRRFREFLRSSVRMAEAVAGDYPLRQALGDPNVENRAAIFTILSEVDPEFGGDYGLEVFDIRGQSVAWAGVTFPPQPPLGGKIGRKGPAVSVVTGQIFTILCSAATILDTKGEHPLGTMYLYRPLHVNVPIHTKFLRGSSFAEDVSSDVRLSFRLDFKPSERDSDLEGSSEEHPSVPLSDLQNSPLGAVLFSQPTYQSYVLSLHERAARISVLSLGLILLLLFAEIFRTLYRVALPKTGNHFRSPLALFAAMSFSLWLCRYAFLGLGFPQRLVHLSIFDPIHYASPFLFGLSRSTGELLITLMTLVANVLLAWRLSLTHSRREGRPARSGVYTIIASLLGVGLIHPLFDAYVSGLRSLVEDSTLSFFNYLAFFSSAPLIFTTINLLLLSLAFLLLTLIVIYLVERILKYPMKEDLARWGFIVLVYLFTGTIWLLVTKHTFYLAERTVLIFLLGSLAVWMDRRVLRAKMSSLMPIVLLTSVSTLISFPIFYEEILSEERNLIRSRTLEALRPAEGSIRSVMEGSLDHFGRSQNIRESLLSKDHPNLENLAFVEWAKSPLSRLSFGSSVTILDGSGLNVSRFGIDIPLGLEQAPAAVLEEIEEAGGKFLTVSKSRIGGEEIELYSGAVPIVADEKVRGAVILTIAVVKAPWGALARLEGVYPTLLRPFSAEQEVRHKYGPAKIVLSTYEKETLVESTDPAIVRGYRPSDLVLGLIFDEKVDYVGAEETIGGKRYMNLYFPQKVDEKVVGMISVGYEKPHRWTALFDLLRLLFTNLLSALGIYLTYRLGSAAIHRDWRRLFSMKRFQHRLLVSFAVLIILPMIFMAYFGRRMIISQQEDWIRSHIEEDLTIARTLMEEESITAAQEIASNPEIIRFVTDPAEKIPAVLNRKGATVSILDPEGGEIWSTGGERADFKIEKEVRSTLLPRVFYSHKPPLALGAIAPIVGEEGESDLRGLVEYGRPIDDGLCRKLSHRIKRDVNVYHKGVEVASTRPELFQSEFLSTKLPGDAFLNVELLGKSSFHAKRAMGAYPYIEGYQPLTDGLGRTAGVLSIPMIYQQHRLDQETARTISLVLVVYGLILSLTLLIGLILSRRISSPIRELTDGTRKVAAGDLDFRIDIKAKDELGDLVASFNKMTGDLKASQEKLVQAEKEVAWREMARQVAHEIKNPLTPMKLSVQHIAQAYKDKAKDFEKILTESTRMVTEQIEVLRNIASEFSSFARLPRRRVERCNINTVMKTSLRLFADSFKGVKIIARYGEPMPSVEADRKEMQGVFVNLIQNALQAMPGGGTLQIRTEVQTAHVEGGEQSLIAIEIVDTGCGIPEDFKGRLFQPSFSTKTEGTGLGLAICKRVIDELGGKIRIDSTVGKGTTVTIKLPVGNTYGE